MFSLCPNHFRLPRFNFQFPRQFPSLNTTFFQTDNQKEVLLQCFVVRAVFPVAVLLSRWRKKTYLKRRPLLRSHIFSVFQMLRHPRLAFDCLSVIFFDYWPIRVSGLLLLCTELTLFCTELPENAFILINHYWVIFSCVLLVLK